MHNNVSKETFKDNTDKCGKGILVKNAKCNKDGIKKLDSYHDFSFKQVKKQSTRDPLIAPLQGGYVFHHVIKGADKKNRCDI